MTNSQVEKEIKNFSDVLLERLHHRVDKIILYGSQSPNNPSAPHKESDIDLLIVVPDDLAQKARIESLAIRAQRAYETDYRVAISPRVIGESQHFNATEPTPSSFMRQVQKTGKTYYGKD